MTAHELASALLEMPDVKVVQWVDGDEELLFDFGSWKEVVTINLKNNEITFNTE